MAQKRAELGPGEQGFSFRVELFEGEELVATLESDDQEEVLNLADLHCHFLP